MTVLKGFVDRDNEKHDLPTLDPTQFAPAEHGHEIDEIDGLNDILAGNISLEVIHGDEDLVSNSEELAAITSEGLHYIKYIPLSKQAGVSYSLLFVKRTRATSLFVCEQYLIDGDSYSVRTRLFTDGTYEVPDGEWSQWSSKIPSVLEGKQDVLPLVTLTLPDGETGWSDGGNGALYKQACAWGGAKPVLIRLNKVGVYDITVVGTLEASFDSNAGQATVTILALGNKFVRTDFRDDSPYSDLDSLVWDNADLTPTAISL